MKRFALAVLGIAMLAASAGAQSPPVITPNSPYVIGANAIVIQGAASVKDVILEPQIRSRLYVSAIWFFADGTWKYHVPAGAVGNAAPIDGGLQPFPGPVASAYVILTDVPPNYPPRPGLTPDQRAQMFAPGPPWDGKGTSNMGNAEIEAFADYPLFWMGESFGPYNLQWVFHQKYIPPPPVPAMYQQDEVYFSYGICHIAPGGKSCPLPAGVQVGRGCLRHPEQLPASIRARPETVRGGGLMYRFGEESVLIWTGTAVVRIGSLADPALVEEGIQQLRGAGRNAAVGPGDPLPAPDFSRCS